MLLLWKTKSGFITGKTFYKNIQDSKNISGSKCKFPTRQTRAIRPCGTYQTKILSMTIKGVL